MFYDPDDRTDYAVAARGCAWAASALLMSPAAARLTVLDLGCPLAESPTEDDVRRVARAVALNPSVQCFAYAGLGRVVPAVVASTADCCLADCWCHRLF